MGWDQEGGGLPYGNEHRGDPSGDQSSECAYHASAQRKVKCLYTCISSEMLSYGRHARDGLLHPPDHRQQTHPSPRISPGALLRMASSSVSLGIEKVHPPMITSCPHATP